MAPQRVASGRSRPLQTGSLIVISSPALREGEVVRLQFDAGKERIVQGSARVVRVDGTGIGVEFVERFLHFDPAYGRFFRPGEAPEKRMFDLPAFVLARLAAAGVSGSEWVGHDTCAEADDFFSNRRAFRRGEPDYGRLLSAIVIV